ncbi:MAG: calcium-binding protein, partial [Actinomycetia bacterium]|nr:calcium-binding protein [Actinomycetes bacterium]
GYYNYTPVIIQETSIDLISQANVDASDLDVIIRTGGTNLEYNTNGVGIDGGDGSLLSSGEAILINFDTAALPDGAENVALTINDFQSDYGDQATVIVTHDTDEDGTLTTDTVIFSATNNSTEILDLSQFKGITQLDIEYTGSGYDLGVGNITYKPTTIGNPDPILVDYTLTDTDGQADTAQLAIYTIDNEITGTVGADSITGGALNDAITGDDGDDILAGGDGHDSIAGGTGDDTLSGDAGNDYLSGGDDADTLSGGAGKDHLDGDAGDDLVDGGTGDDIVQGGSGDDLVFGGAGDDILEGETGDDSLSGGSGIDTLIGGEG